MADKAQFDSEDDVEETEDDLIEFPIIIKLIKPLRSVGAKSGIETVVTEVRIDEEPTAGQLRLLMRVPGDEKIFKSVELFTDLPAHLVSALGVRDLRAIDAALAPFFGGDRG